MPCSLHEDSFSSGHEPEPQQAGGVAEQLTLVPQNWWKEVAVPFLGAGRFIRSATYLPCQALALVCVKDDLSLPWSCP